ncbi:hypothetical protein V8C26DRAFT_340572 [Trichoderma gracile]
MLAGAKSRNRLESERRERKKSDRRLSPGRLGRLLLLTWATSGANRPGELFEQLLGLVLPTQPVLFRLATNHSPLWSVPSPPRRGLSTRIHAPRYRVQSVRYCTVHVCCRLHHQMPRSLAQGAKVTEGLARWLRGPGEPSSACARRAIRRGPGWTAKDMAGMDAGVMQTSAPASQCGPGWMWMLDVAHAFKLSVAPATGCHCVPKRRVQRSRLRPNSANLPRRCLPGRVQVALFSAVYQS